MEIIEEMFSIEKTHDDIFIIRIKCAEYPTALEGIQQILNDKKDAKKWREMMEDKGYSEFTKGSVERDATNYQIVRRIKEYLRECPIEHSRTYYEYDTALQEGRNDVKDEILKIIFNLENNK